MSRKRRNAFVLTEVERVKKIMKAPFKDSAFEVTPSDQLSHRFARANQLDEFLWAAVRLEVPQEMKVILIEVILTDWYQFVIAIIDDYFEQIFDSKSKCVRVQFCKENGFDTIQQSRLCIAELQIRKDLYQKYLSTLGDTISDIRSGIRI